MPSAGPTVPGVQFCEPSAINEISQEGQLSSLAVMIASQAGQRLRSSAFVGNAVTASFGLRSGFGCCVRTLLPRTKRETRPPAAGYHPLVAGVASAWSGSDSGPWPRPFCSAMIRRMAPVTTIAETITIKTLPP